MAENTTLICDFSDTSSFTFDETADHGSSKERSRWQYQADTLSSIPSCSQTYSIGAFLNWFGSSYAENLESEYYGNMSAHNGFAYLDMIELWDCDSGSYTTLDAYVKFNNPIYTYGKSGIDIHFNQFCRRFNNEKYYLEWSHSSTFQNYGSIEFNVKNVDVSSNSYAKYQQTIPILQGVSSCNIISDDPDEPTYFRIRVSAPPSASLPHGYFIILDDISWSETPATRLEVKGSYIYNGYTYIPPIVTTDNMSMNIAVKNTGTTDITNAKAIAEYSVLGEVDSNSVWYQFTSHSSDPITLEAGTHLTPVYDGNGDIAEYIEEYVYSLLVDSAPQPNYESGTYKLQKKLSFDGECSECSADYSDGTSKMDIGLPIQYYVSDSMTDGTHNYRWARDNGYTGYGYAFTYGMVTIDGLNYYSSAADYNKAGYKVCVAYNASAFEGDVYANGVEIVPAFNVCEAGTKIRASLNFGDYSADTWYDFFQPVLDSNNQQVQSDIYTVKEEDLNEYYDYTVFFNGEYNSVYLPFQSVKLETDVPYYVCYELQTAGEFAVARSINYTNTFSSGISSNVIIKTPGVTDNYGFGSFFPNTTLDNSVPMIRLMVSEASADFTPDTNNQSTDVAIQDITITENEAGLFTVSGKVVNAENCDTYFATYAYNSPDLTDEYVMDFIVTNFSGAFTEISSEPTFEFYNIPGNSTVQLFVCIVCSGDTMLLRADTMTSFSNLDGTAFTSVTISDITKESVYVSMEMNDQTAYYYYAFFEYDVLEFNGLTTADDIKTFIATNGILGSSYYTTENLSGYLNSLSESTKYGFFTYSYNGNGELGDVDLVIFTTLSDDSEVETDNVTVCGGYIINGEYQTESGEYYDYETNHKINLTVLPSDETIIEKTICNGESYTFEGNVYTSTGVYSFTYNNMYDCDSVVKLYLTVIPQIEKNVTVAICEGDKYLFGSNLLSEQGSYTDTLQSVDGCDSIVNLTLVYLPSYDTTIEVTICEGTSYTLNGFNESTEGVYTKHLSSSTCCDSLVTLILHVSNTITNDYYITICDGNTYEFNGQTLSESGDYTYTSPSPNGCDSVFTLHLTVSDPINIEITDSIIMGGVYLFGDDTLTASGTYTKTFISENNCDSVVTLNLYVLESGLNDVVQEANDWNIYPNPAKDKVTIDLGVINSDTEISIVDNSGRTVRTLYVNKENTKSEIDISNLAAGSYYIKGPKGTKKLIIK